MSSLPKIAIEWVTKSNTSVKIASVDFDLNKMTRRKDALPCYPIIVENEEIGRMDRIQLQEMVARYEQLKNKELNITLEWLHNGCSVGYYFYDVEKKELHYRCAKNRKPRHF